MNNIKNGFLLFECLCAGAISACMLTMILYNLSDLIENYRRFKIYHVKNYDLVNAYHFNRLQKLRGEEDATFHTYFSLHNYDAESFLTNREKHYTIAQSKCKPVYAFLYEA